MSTSRQCIDVICLGTEAGTHFPGQCKAPEATIKAGGLVSKLNSTGYEVIVHDKVLSDPVHATAARWRPAPKQNGVRNEQSTLIVMRAVRDYLRRNQDKLHDNFPLILGGDCSITPAVFSGLCEFHPVETKVGLLYIDGDADLTLPAQTDVDGSTAIMDAMTISHLTGRSGGLESMKAFAKPDGRPLIDPENIVLFGFDPHQPATEHWVYLLESGFKAFTCPTVRSNPLARAREAMAWLQTKVDVVYVHFDVDVVGNRVLVSLYFQNIHTFFAIARSIDTANASLQIDSGEFPLANYPHYNGLDVTDALTVLEEMLSYGIVRGLTVTEMNPNNDPDGTMISRIVDSIVKGIARRWK